MKKILFIISLASVFTLKGYTQQYHNPSGLDKFKGHWLYTNGTDSIFFYGAVRYVGSEYVQIKGLSYYYAIKQGNTLLYSNLENSTDDYKSNMGGTKPFGPNLDSLIIVGTDKLKRKRDEGYLIINSAGTQLRFVRSLGVTGGGLRHYKTGQEPLSGYTLPADFTMQKYTPVFEEARGQ